MPRRKPEPEPAPAPVPQVPASAPVRVEIRVGSRLLFAEAVYNPAFGVTDDTLTFTAARQPVMIDAPAPTRPATRFIDQTDPRDGAEVILTAHTGRRDLPPDEIGVEAETEEL